MSNPIIKTCQNYQTRHENVLSNVLAKTPIPSLTIQKAIQYALFPGGKRFRPLLVYLVGELVNAPLPALDYIAAAIELTHCYSLVHDDLPAMDNDDMRRGKPSCHRAFDEATAILVGDGMQALAIEVLLTYLPKTLAMAQVVAVTRELVITSGPSGMVSGQSLDLSELARATLTEEELTQIHRLKTGMLISACINMVLAASTPGETAASALREFADHIGLLFQMQDDYLDQYANQALGKGRQSDEANEKHTFATLYGQKELLALLEIQYQKVLHALNLFGEKASHLRQLIEVLKQQIT